MNNILSFVSLACSKDPTKPYINYAYRDVKHLVATDGHRLHYADMVDSLEPHYVNGMKNDVNFPQWQMALPKNSPILSVSFMCNKDIIQYLELIAKAARVNDKHSCRINISLSDKYISFSLLSKSNGLVFTFRELLGEELGDVNPNIIEDCNMDINANYLLDPLKFQLKGSSKAGKMTTISFHGQLSPVVVELSDIGKAVIMPLRKRD